MTSQQERFLELRAEGASYRTIALELRVSERTLFYWKDKLESEVHWEEAVGLENLQHELLGTRGLRARRLARRLDQIEEELDKRSLADLSTARLFSLADALRREIIKVTTPEKPRCTSTKKRELETTPLDFAKEEPSAHDSSSKDAEAECSRAAIAVPLAPKVAQASFTPIQHQIKDLEVPASFNQPAQPSGADCKNTAITLEPAAAAPLKPNSTAEPGADLMDQPVSKEAALVPPWDVINGMPSEATLDPSKNSATGGRLASSPSPQAVHKPIRCMPLSPERLIGNNITFRAVLAKRGPVAQPAKTL